MAERWEANPPFGTNHHTSYRTHSAAPLASEDRGFTYLDREPLGNGVNTSYSSSHVTHERSRHLVWYSFYIFWLFHSLIPHSPVPIPPDHPGGECLLFQVHDGTWQTTETTTRSEGALGAPARTTTESVSSVREKITSHSSRNYVPLSKY